MNAERWKQIDGLFAAVLEMPEAERENFLLKNCVGDEDFKNEVLSLLWVAPHAGGFLETSAMGIAAKNLAADKTTIPGACFSGKTIGTCRIEKPLGAGVRE